MRLIFLGDVVGDTGRAALARALPELRRDYAPDAVVVNGENAAGGRGITPRLCEELFRSGVDVITLGDHAWDQRELFTWLDSPAAERVLRPHNHQLDTPGRGSCLLDTPAGRLGVLCLCGRTFMRPGLDNPFTTGYEEALRLREAGAEAILTDMHGEASSEKVAMGWRLDGVVSAVIGTHTHVPTADSRILPGGTAFQCDAGMCGSLDGVIGREREAVLQGCITALPCKYPVGGFPAQVCGCLIDTEGLRATAIRRLFLCYDCA